MTNSTLVTLAILVCGSATTMILFRAMLDVVLKNFSSSDDEG